MAHIESVVKYFLASFSEILLYLLKSYDLWRNACTARFWEGTRQQSAFERSFEIRV